MKNADPSLYFLQKSNSKDFTSLGDKFDLGCILGRFGVDLGMLWGIYWDSFLRAKHSKEQRAEHREQSRQQTAERRSESRLRAKG